MKTIVSILLIAFLSPLAFSQTDVLVDGDFGAVRVTHILKDQGKLTGYDKTGLKTKFVNHHCTSDYSGNQIYTNLNMVDFTRSGKMATDIPDLGSFNGSKILSDNQTIFGWNYIDENRKDFSVYFLNYLSNKILYSYPFDMNPDSPKFIRISANGVTIAVITGFNHIQVYSVSNNSLVKEKELSPHPVVSYDLMVSETGNRVFYKFVGTGVRLEVFLTYLEKDENGWSDEIIVPTNNMVYISEDPHSDLKKHIIYNGMAVGIINDGKSILFRNGDTEELFFFHEEEGEWKRVELVGKYSVSFRDIAIREKWGAYDIPTTCSDDGRVVALLQPKSYWPTIGVINYDVIVFIKDAKGNWSKHQANPSDVGVIPNILISGDGTKLFWIPEKELSATGNTPLK